MKHLETTTDLGQEGSQLSHSRPSPAGGLGLWKITAAIFGYAIARCDRAPEHVSCWFSFGRMHTCKTGTHRTLGKAACPDIFGTGTPSSTTRSSDRLGRTQGRRLFFCDVLVWVPWARAALSHLLNDSGQNSFEKKTTNYCQTAKSLANCVHRAHRLQPTNLMQ